MVRGSSPQTPLTRTLKGLTMLGTNGGSIEVPGAVLQLVEKTRSLAGHEARKLLGAASPDVRAGWVLGLQQLADAVAAATLVATEAFDAQGDGNVLHGAASSQAWLRGACRISGAEAAERVRLARSSRGLLGESVEAVREGRITYQHLRAVERATRSMPDHQKLAATQLLTDLAEVATLSDVRVAGQHLAHVVDPDGSLAELERQFDRRYLTLSPLMDGMTAVDGLLDAEASALLTSALEPFLVPVGADDRRSASQRRADGLLQLVQSACDHRLTPVVGAERPHLQVIVDPRVGPRVEPGTRSLPPGRLVGSPGGSGWLHPVAVSRIGCDPQMTALILDEQGVVVDLGRTKRLFSPQQRRVLALRDGGCRFPGCDRPPGHTDAHHLIPWLDGGSTDLSNALLLCRHHHRAVHEGGWRLRPVDVERGTRGSVEVIGPRGQRLTSFPRGP